MQRAWMNSLVHLRCWQLTSHCDHITTSFLYSLYASAAAGVNVWRNVNIFPFPFPSLISSLPYTILSPFTPTGPYLLNLFSFCYLSLQNTQQYRTVTYLGLRTQIMGLISKPLVSAACVSKNKINSSLISTQVFVRRILIFYLVQGTRLRRKWKSTTIAVRATCVWQSKKQLRGWWRCWQYSTWFTQLRRYDRRWRLRSRRTGSLHVAVASLPAIHRSWRLLVPSTNFLVKVVLCED